MISNRLFGLLPIFLVLSLPLAATPETKQEGNIVYVSIPPDVSTAAVEVAAPGIAARLHEHVSANLRQLRAIGARSAGAPEPDLLIVLVDHDGQPILPDRSAKARKREQPSGGALSFRFDSPGNPWSAGEVATIQSLFRDMYPLAKEIYGDPAFTIQVNVRKDPTLFASGTYTPGLNEIAVRSLEPDVICHEMIHAFRDEYLIGMNTFEEGMTRAAEVEVFNRLPALAHWDRSHGYEHDVFYEALNRPEIGGFRGNFSWGFINVLLRYQLAGYAWGKALIENPGFLRAFNTSLYESADANPALTADESGLLDIAATSVKTVEGDRFRDWYRNQGILNTSPPTGQFLYQFRAGPPEDFVFYVFERNASGSEWMWTGIPVSVDARDYAGRPLGSGSGVTTPFGWFGMPAQYQGYAGRVSALTKATLAGGRVLELNSYAYAGSQAGVFGLVENEDTGSVMITPLDARKSAVTVRLANGVFSAPSLESVRGTFRVTVDPLNGKRFTRTFTKDASRYFLRLSSR